MKPFLILLLVLFSSGVQASSLPEDSTRKEKFIHRFNLYLNMTELGIPFPIREKNRPALQNGLGEYYDQHRGSVRFALLGASVYYKNKIGIGVIFANTEFKSSTSHFMEYLQAKYPNYYVRDYPEDYQYSAYGVTFSLAYRKRFKQFVLEPKFRVSINSINAYSDDFTSYLKEKGTNQYMEVHLSEQQHGHHTSYHFILSGMYQFKSNNVFQWETGIQSEFFLAPVSKTVTLSERPYGMEAVTVTQQFSRLNPALAFSLFVNWKFGR